MSIAARPLAAVTALVAGLIVPTACSSIPGMQDPTVTLSPRYYIYELTGKARLQSLGSPVVENAPVTTQELGQNGHDDDIGGVLMIGDGFSGFDFEHQKITIDDSSVGVLTQDFGELGRGTTVNSSFAQDEFRLGYIAELFDHELELDDDNQVRLRLGAGGTLVHREGTFEVWDDPDRVTTERLDFSDDGVPYLSLRLRSEWRNLSLQIDWDYNPDITFGGDFDGDLHDIEVLGRYSLDAQAVTFVVGYRWSDIQTTGNTNGLRYDTDFRIQGYVLGLEFAF